MHLQCFTTVVAGSALLTNVLGLLATVLLYTDGLVLGTRRRGHHRDGLIGVPAMGVLDCLYCFVLLVFLLEEMRLVNLLLLDVLRLLVNI